MQTYYEVKTLVLIPLLITEFLLYGIGIIVVSLWLYEMYKQKKEKKEKEAE